MSQNAEKGLLMTGPSQEIDAVAADAIVPQLIARPVPVQTSGRLEFAARCPGCRTWHRHVSLGEKDAPCGAHYVLEFKNKIKGAA
ncbi:hypothetical protein [Streptomyces sp. S1A1-7]|uniref:hypothetical protein n=1 Tax=Streptomyces sp. S1A1-7 TaxID=2594459 RepID=UPI0013E03507|nr:hypothetical protein [Streptomyces sp. S1A1-7]